MDYNILEAKLEYKYQKLTRVTVLVDMTGKGSKPFTDVRAITASAGFSAGYLNLLPGAGITEDLLQLVAASGMETGNINDFFPNWKSKYL